MARFLLYGANGFTGQLLAAEAVRRGHRPVLAGRNAAKVETIARHYGLDWQAFDLSNPERLASLLREFELVFHAAGPFVHTAEPMVQACLAAKTHYLDISGELQVLEATLTYDAHAREQGIVLISGAGFDIVPTDCLGSYVSKKLPGATHLELAFAGMQRASAGTVNTMLEAIPRLEGGTGAIVRREGQLVAWPWGRGRKRVRFADGRARTVLPVPWGDVATAEASTGIPNVTAYFALPFVPGAGFLIRAAAKVLAFAPARSVAHRVVDRVVQGPGERLQKEGRVQLWACATGPQGQKAEAWLETGETYRFTAAAGIRLVEKVLAERPAGALTPSLALGPDFVLEIPDTRRLDAL